MRALLLSLGGSLVLTLLLEGGFGLIWGLRGKDFILCLLVNFLTNPVVVLCWHLTRWYLPAQSGIVTLALEAGAVFVEARIYCTCAENLRHPILFAVFSNAFSFGTGLLL